MGHHYVYGQIPHYPEMPYYNCAITHKGTGFRDFPCNAIKDDGVPYQVYTAESYCDSCNRCNRVARYNTMNNLVNIETYIDKVLTVTLYGAKKELDKTIKMRIGNKYCITYVTERGLQTVTGIFKEVSTNMPDECTKYIGIYNTISSTAYIGMDCSTEGSSDKRLIYIASIRYIEELFDDESAEFADLSQEEKLNYLYTNVSSVLDTLNEFMETYNSTVVNTDTSDDTTDTTQTDTNPPEFPPPPPIGGPYIIGARPPFPPPPPPPQPTNQTTTDDMSNTTYFDSDTIIRTLNKIKIVLDSFVEVYIDSKSDENNNCNCGEDDSGNSGSSSGNNGSGSSDYDNALINNQLEDLDGRVNDLEDGSLTIVVDP